MTPQDDPLAATLISVLLDDPTDPRHASIRLANAMQRAGDACPATLVVRMHPQTHKCRHAALAPALSNIPAKLRLRLDYRCNLQHDEATVSISTMKLASDVRCMA